MAGPGRPFPKGKSGNPGGQPSLVNDLKRAQIVGIPPEIQEVLDEWRDGAGKRLTELGAEGFIAGLNDAIRAATARVLPMDPAEARAMWWRTVFPVFLRGPSGNKDSVWTYTSQEIGVRLLGKPKETIAIEDTGGAPIDWSKVPEDERESLLASIVKLQTYLGEPTTDTEH